MGTYLIDELNLHSPCTHSSPMNLRPPLIYSHSRSLRSQGYFRLERGTNALDIESECAWATPGSYTTQNFKCYVDGSNCVTTNQYTDPSALL